MRLISNKISNLRKGNWFPYRLMNKRRLRHFWMMSWPVPPGWSWIQREAEGWQASKLQGLSWLCRNALQRQVDARVSNAWESSTQGSRSLQRWFWVRSKWVELCVEALKSEQGFGHSHVSSAWAKPCQALRGAEYAGGIIIVDIRTKGKYSEVTTD